MTKVIDLSMRAFTEWKATKLNDMLSKNYLWETKEEIKKQSSAISYARHYVKEGKFETMEEGIEEYVRMRYDGHREKIKKVTDMTYEEWKWKVEMGYIRQ